MASHYYYKSIDQPFSFHKGLLTTSERSPSRLLLRNFTCSPYIKRHDSLPNFLFQLEQHACSNSSSSPQNCERIKPSQLPLNYHHRPSASLNKLTNYGEQTHITHTLLFHSHSRSISSIKFSPSGLFLRQIPPPPPPSLHYS